MIYFLFVIVNCIGVLRMVMLVVGMCIYCRMDVELMSMRLGELGFVCIVVLCICMLSECVSCVIGLWIESVVLMFLCSFVNVIVLLGRNYVCLLLFLVSMVEVCVWMLCSISGMLICFVSCGCV